jgi:hypothetical protein
MKEQSDRIDRRFRIASGIGVALSYIAPTAYSFVNEGHFSPTSVAAGVISVIALGIPSINIAGNMKDYVQNYYYIKKDPLEIGAREAQNADVSNLRDIFEVNVQK